MAPKPKVDEKVKKDSKRVIKQKQKKLNSESKT